MNLFIQNTNRKRQYFSILVIVILVSGVCFGLSSFIGYRVIAFILLLTVSLIAVSFDILPVLLAAILSAFIWDFFFIPPRFTLHVDNTEDGILLIMYFVIAMINGVLTYKIRQVEKTARLKEEKANSVKLYNTILNSLSHELRTPIATIIGAADNLQDNKNLSDQNREQLISEISKASLRLNQQVENLLNISRLESGHIKPKNDWCDVEELIYESVKRIEDVGINHKIEINVNSSMPLCFLDKGMLEQVVYNLLSNAVMHTKPGTRVDISASCHADLLEIIIEDNGKGFSEAEMKEAFHKFSRNKDRQANGSGLGLSIVKGFTEALGGVVDLEKAMEGGAKFTVTIPVKTSQIKLENEQS
jgi:two-component system sensor histidine kinase KdpD